MKASPGGILAAYRHIDSATEAIGALKKNGYDDFTVYSPTPNEEILEAVAHRVSRYGCGRCSAGSPAS